MPSAKTAVSEALVDQTPAEERPDLPEQWLELAKVSRRTAIETVRKHGPLHDRAYCAHGVRRAT